MPVFDFTNAKPPEFELIPEGAVVTVSIHIRGGGVGDEGLRKRGESEKGVHEALDLEFVVLDGPHKGKRFWDYLVVEGTGDGQKKMAVSNMHTLKLLLDSALGLDPKDESPEARAARTVSESWFEGRVCMVKIGKQKGGQPRKGGGVYPDSNCIAEVITKGKQGWQPMEQPPPFDPGSTPSSSTPSTPAAPVQRPKWA